MHQPWSMPRPPCVSQEQAARHGSKRATRARALASPASPRPGGAPPPARGLRAAGAGDAGRLPPPAFSLFSPRRARGPSAGGAGGASAARARASAASSSACAGPQTLGVGTPSSSVSAEPQALGVENAFQLRPSGATDPGYYSDRAPPRTGRGDSELR